MIEKLVVIFHVQDQGVRIEDIRMYPYTQDGLNNALIDKNEAFNWDCVYNCVYILDEIDAFQLYDKLSNAGSENIVYDYMRENSNSTELEDITI